MYWYWDPEYYETKTMIANALGVGGEGDKGPLNVINTILEKVVGWDTSHTHVGLIPEGWKQVALQLAQRTALWARNDWAVSEQILNSINPDAASGGNPLPSLDNPATGNEGAFLGSTTQSSYAGITVGPVQRQRAEQIMGVGWSLLSDKHSQDDTNKACACGIAVAMVEASLLNQASQGNPESINYRHDKVAEGDLDSVGLFQQRNSWGTIADRMDPYRSSALFFHALMGKAGWPQTPFGPLCQSVQVSAYPERYAMYEKFAFAMVRDMLKTKQSGSGNSRSWMDNSSSSGTTTGGRTMTDGGVTTTSSAGRGQSTGQLFLSHAMGLVDRYGSRLQYLFGGTNIGAEPPGPLDCSAFVQAVMLRTLGHATTTPRTSASQAAWTRHLSTEQALKTPGALMFRSSNGQSSGVHHVEISLGNGKQTVGAHFHGANPDVGIITSSDWSFGGIIPILIYDSIGGGEGPSGSIPSAGTLVGGTNQWPVPDHRIGTGFRQPGDRWDLGFHTGVDFPYVSTGDPVASVEAGKVVTCGYGVLGDSYGNTVVVQTSDFWAIYAHLSQINVATNDQVKVGDKVGEVGATGTNVTGTHLHFEVRKYPFNFVAKTLVDPVVFIKNGVMSDGSGSGGPGGGVGGRSSSETPWQKLGVDQWKNNAGFSSDPTSFQNLFGEAPWAPIMSAGTAASVEAASLVGSHALLNDQPLLGYLMNCFHAILRAFCSAPNGDLIAWFPDYYGLWKTAAILRVEPIEIKDFTVMWSDDQFVTHQFTQAGTAVQFNVDSADIQSMVLGQVGYTSMTVGIANIDDPLMLQSLFGIPPENHTEFTRWVYDRFGARPNYFTADGLVSPAAAFFLAVHTFMIQWAYQYRADIALTFMPEAWPGMLIQMPSFDFQAYIIAVTHTGSFGDGGKFETTVNISSPAYMPRKGEPDVHNALFGLPIAGGYNKSKQVGSPLPGSYQTGHDNSNDDTPHQGIQPPGGLDLS
jgi:murein DD-endopeptidase MepM/ murein hydrolase activator NlpD